MTSSSRATDDPMETVDDTATGLSWLSTWTRVYLAILVWFVFCVGLLAALSARYP